MHTLKVHLSMLRRFFEDERTPEGEKIDNRHLFEGLAIMDTGEKYLAHMGQYPVISLSLKSAKQNPQIQWEVSSYPSSTHLFSFVPIVYVKNGKITSKIFPFMLKREIAAEFSRHQYVLAGKMNGNAQEKYEAILKEREEASLYADAIRFLSECLYKLGKHLLHFFTRKTKTAAVILADNRMNL